MSKINTVRSDLTLEDDDYILVIGHDGELKSVFMPDVDANDVPESVRQTLAQYGVTDINYVTGNTTLH
jgi:ABC-type uncharacterized transport system ATPase component